MFPGITSPSKSKNLGLLGCQRPKSTGPGELATLSDPSYSGLAHFPNPSNLSLTPCLTQVPSV